MALTKFIWIWSYLISIYLILNQSDSKTNLFPTNLVWKQSVWKQSGSEAIWFRSNLVPKQSGSKAIWFQSNLVPKQSGSKAIWFRTNLIPNQSDSRPIWFQTIWFWPNLTVNSSDTEPIRYWTWGCLSGLTPMCFPSISLPLQSWNGSQVLLTRPVAKFIQNIGQPLLGTLFDPCRLAYLAYTSNGWASPP
jgi:hypothetical protein